MITCYVGNFKYQNYFYFLFLIRQLLKIVSILILSMHLYGVDGIFLIMILSTNGNCGKMQHQFST